MKRYNYEQAMNILSNGNNTIETKISDLVDRYDAIDETTDPKAFEKYEDLATEFFALNVDLKTLMLDVAPGTNWASYDYVKYGIEIRDPEQKKTSDLNRFLVLIGFEMYRRDIRL